jgi:hypothetical protein
MNRVQDLILCTYYDSIDATAYLSGVINLDQVNKSMKGGVGCMEAAWTQILMIVGKELKVDTLYN